ncbi:hypothetical protein DPEC_G00026410 [Dallia pectoralis]|uniref:Uncharacterized protein n=1 Tax=Dallia pectoralis TaxID=75939 RepID=A0ACC2HHT0_DALPE|nr:hypothetical protein DPEC_G00026410 [Dallia pectoralis]
MFFWKYPCERVWTGHLDRLKKSRAEVSPTAVGLARWFIAVDLRAGQSDAGNRQQRALTQSFVFQSVVLASGKPEEKSGRWEKAKSPGTDALKCKKPAELFGCSATSSSSNIQVITTSPNMSVEVT